MTDELSDASRRVKDRAEALGQQVENSPEYRKAVEAARRVEQEGRTFQRGAEQVQRNVSQDIRRAPLPQLAWTPGRGVSSSVLPGLGGVSRFAAGRGIQFSHGTAIHFGRGTVIQIERLSGFGIGHGLPGSMPDFRRRVFDRNDKRR